MIPFRCVSLPYARWSYGENHPDFFYSPETDTYSALGYYLFAYCQVPQKYLSCTRSVEELHALLVKEKEPITPDLVSAQSPFDTLVQEVNRLIFQNSLRDFFRQKIRPTLTWRQRFFFLLIRLFRRRDRTKLYREFCLEVLFYHYLGIALFFSSPSSEICSC